MEPDAPMTALLWGHFVSLAFVLAVFFLAPTIASKDRPVGSAFAWFLAIILIPFVGIPLFLVFGSRKFKGKARALAESSPTAHPGSIEWLTDGVKAFEVLLAAIKGSKESIRIATFVLADDPAGSVIVDSLTAKAREGVKVHLLVDDLLFFRRPRRALKELKAAGGEVRRFMPLVHRPFRGQANLRNHRKIALFDGRRAMIGGMNLADEYLGPDPRPDRWRDLSAIVKGPCVAELDGIFCADWRQATGRELTRVPAPSNPQSGAATEVTVVPSGPDHSGDAIHDLILLSLFQAKHHLAIVTPYFVPDEPLMRSIEIAVRRGVRVDIMVPAKSNHFLADLVGAPLLRDLVDVGVGVHRFTPSMLHAKAILVDRETAIVGSANLDRRSLFLNYEIAVRVTGEAARNLMPWFDGLLASSIRGMPPERAAARYLAPWARLVSPLL